MLDQLLDPRIDDTRTPAIGYIRVSLAREEMISPELQRTAIEEWARRTKHRLVDWVVDLDKTGRNFKRRIMRAIERVERGEANVIAVWKYSRFGRNRAGIELNLTRIENAGGQLISATEEVDASTACGWFQRDVLFSVATFESKRAGEQWKETHDSRRQNGLPASGMRRFGYIWHQRKIYQPDGTVTIQEERYEPHPENGPVVVDLYQRFVDGESFRSMAIWLNNNGFCTVRDSPWDGKAVMRYLDSGFAAGYLRIHTGCKLPDCVGACDNYELTKHPTRHHPQLISEDLWQQYLRRRERTRSQPKAPSAIHPFSRFPRCGRCGGGMKRVATSSATVTRLTCRRYDDSGPTACEGSHAVIADLRKAILTFLKATVAPAIEAAAGESADVGSTARRFSPEAERDRLEAQVTRLDRAIGKAMRTFALTDEDDPDGILEGEYRKLLTSLREEKAQLAQSLKDLSAGAVETADDRHARAVKVAVGLLDEWSTLSPARINALLEHVIEKIIVLRDHGGFEIHPAWSPNPWISKGPGKPVPKRELLAELWKQHPDATGREIAEALAGKGISVTPTYALVVRGRLRASDDGEREPRRYGRGGKISTAEREAREQVRLEAVRRLQAGESVDDVSAALEVTKRTVHRWRKAWRERGEAGIASTAVQRRSIAV